MAPKSTPTKPNRKKRSPHGIRDDSRRTKPDLVKKHGPSQKGLDQPGSRDMKNYAWRALSWILGLSGVLITIGLLIQGINQSSDTIKWFIYRRGYPYFPAITFSTLVVTSAVVFPDVVKKIVKEGEVHWIIRLLLDALPQITFEKKSIIAWRILLGLSVISFIATMSFPRCLAPNSILVSFNILDNDILIANISQRETIFLNSGSFVDIEVKLESSLFNLAPPQIKCEWTTHTGDGRLIQRTNCKINYQTGSDGNPDPVAVSIMQKGCASPLGYYSFFISNTP